MLPEPESPADTPIVEVERAEWHGAERARHLDQVVREEPLEIRVRGVPIAVLMRTPGHDEELVRGFLRTEGIVEDPAHVRAVRPCTDADDTTAEGNILQVSLDPSVDVDVAKLRRNLYASSSCGVCGKASIERALQVAGPLSIDSSIPAATLYDLPERLRAEQAVFSATGGLHGAGLFDRRGQLLAVREDVGRHNAVDKVVGWAGGRPQLRPYVLVVSGRVSFEITQKALAARIPVLAAVSAPSSLAIDLARRSGITLVAFVRGQRLCVYAGDERLEP